MKLTNVLLMAIMAILVLAPLAALGVQLENEMENKIMAQSNENRALRESEEYNGYEAGIENNSTTGGNQTATEYSASEEEEEEY